MKLTPKFLFTILPIAIFCTSLAIGIVYSFARSALQNQSSIHQQEIAQQASEKIDRFLYERKIDIRALAEQEQIEMFLTSRITPTTATNANANLHDFQQLSPNWRAFNLLDLTGTVRASSDEETLAQGLLNQHPSLSGLYTEARSGKVVVSDVFKVDANSMPKAVYFTPVRNTTGIVIGVAAGEIAWPAITEILQAGKGTTLYLVNHDGILLGRSGQVQPTELLSRSYHDTTGFARAAVKPVGAEVLPSLGNAKESAVVGYAAEAGFNDYKGHGWYILSSLPTKIAFAETEKLWLILLAALSGTVGVSVFLIVALISRLFVRPVRLVSSAVTRVTLGDLTQTVPVTSHDELGMLGKNFNEMTYQLAATHRNLQASTHEAQQGRAQLESSINGLRQGFILTDHQGQSLMINKAARRLIHQTSQVKKADLAAMIKALPESLKLTEKIEHTIKTREVSKFPAVALGGRFLNIYLSPVMSEEETIGCVLLLEDITEERIMQRSRDEFFSIASHELRTPLTAIRGNTALIQQYYPEQLKDDSLREMVGDIHDSSIRLIEIVNDFLDASRLEQDKMQFSPEAFSLEKIVEKVVYELGVNTTNKGLYLKFDKNLGSLPLVYADANRVKQIVYNLVGNAMKFTEKGGVNITAEAKGGKLKVLVTDTGLGISPEGQQLLFHKFQQTGSSILTRDVTRGTGLGLYISKLLVEHMDGRIALERSEVGVGTTFSFTLPLATKAQLAAPRVHTPEEQATSVERAAINPVSRDQKTTAPSTPDKAQKPASPTKKKDV